MVIGSIEEEFFLKSINVERVFEFIERTDYLFLYNIKECIKKSECPGGAYLTEIAAHMDLSITEASKAVKNLEDKGYVSWKLDENKEKTYVVLTNKVVELSLGQKKKMTDAYERITSAISKEDLKVTLHTLSKIRQILDEIR